MAVSTKRQEKPETHVRLAQDEYRLIRHITVETGETAAEVIRRVFLLALPHLPEGEQRIASVVRS